MRALKKCVAITLAAAMVLTASPATSDAAKKPALSKKKASVEVGKTVKIKVKNGNKKAKVTWKSSKAKVAKITKKSTKGKSAYATVKGVKKGKAVLSGVCQVKCVNLFENF